MKAIINTENIFDTFFSSLEPEEKALLEKRRLRSRAIGEAKILCAKGEARRTT